MKGILILLLVISWIPAMGQKDTLFMRDGQILIGKLKGMSLGKTDFDGDNIPIISIKANKIKTIHATGHIYKLQTIRKQIYYTSLQPSGDGTVRITIGKASQELPIEEISSLYPLLGKTGALWEGNLSAGYSYTRSSNIGRGNASAKVAYQRRKWGILTKGSLITTKTDSSYDIENSDANLYGSFLLSPSWQAIAITSYQHNLELGLSRRYQEGLAMGYSLLSTLYVRSKLISGLVLSQEKSTEGVFTPTQVEVPFIVLFDFFHFAKPDMSLSLSQSLYTGITEWGRFRQDAQLNLYVKIITDFSFTIQLYDNYDNRPPGANAEKFDYGIVFSLTYMFSQ